MKYRIVLLSTAAAALNACAGDPTTPTLVTRDTSAAVQTDSLAYRLVRTDVSYDGRIAFAFTNRDARSVEITNCLGTTTVGLEKLVGDRWVLAWSPTLPLCLSAPIVVAPGATYRTELLISAGRPGTTTEPKFLAGTVDGVYRMIWGALSYSGPARGTSPARIRR